MASDQAHPALCLQMPVSLCVSLQTSAGEHDSGQELMPAVLCRAAFGCTCGVGTGGRPPLTLAGSMTIAFDSSRPSGRRVHFCRAQVFSSIHSSGQLQRWSLSC